MMNKNKYKLFGRIIAALSGEYPPLVSKKFTNNVMARINKDNKKIYFLILLGILSTMQHQFWLRLLLHIY